MKKKKAPNEARSRTMTAGTTISEMRVPVFELDDLWVLAAELVAVTVAALAVAPSEAPVVAVMIALEEASVAKAPAADSEENSAASETIDTTPVLDLYVVPAETKVVVL